MSPTRQTSPLKLGRKAKPTLKHRPAIWECMLGTVYSQSPTGEVKFFDYRWDDAVAWAQVTPEGDPRTFRAAQGTAHVRKGQWVLYVLEQAPVAKPSIT